jgi:hypothetical protein
MEWYVSHGNTHMRSPGGERIRALLLLSLIHFRQLMSLFLRPAAKRSSSHDDDDDIDTSVTLSIADFCVRMIELVLVSSDHHRAGHGRDQMSQGEVHSV